LAQPAPGPAPAGPPVSSGNPPVRYDWQGNHRKAQAALAARDYKTAIILFTEILDWHARTGRLPKGWVAPTYYFRGKAYRSSKQYDKAVADYTAATQADPKMDVAFYELGATYQAMNQHQKAIGAFSGAIAIRNNNGDYFYGRCVSYSWTGNFKSAISDCEAATRIKRNAEWLAVLGRLYEDSGQKAKAIEAYKAALAINPSEPTALEGLKQLQK
jgi:tetratricopeptide (TPR) repeat protein